MLTVPNQILQQERSEVLLHCASKLIKVQEIEEIQIALWEVAKMVCINLYPSLPLSAITAVIKKVKNVPIKIDYGNQEAESIVGVRKVFKKAINFER